MYSTSCKQTCGGFYVCIYCPDVCYETSLDVCVLCVPRTGRFLQVLQQHRSRQLRFVHEDGAVRGSGSRLGWTDLPPSALSHTSQCPPHSRRHFVLNSEGKAWVLRRTISYTFMHLNYGLEIIKNHSWNSLRTVQKCVFGFFLHVSLWDVFIFIKFLRGVTCSSRLGWIAFNIFLTCVQKVWRAKQLTPHLISLKARPFVYISFRVLSFCFLGGDVYESLLQEQKCYFGRC